VSNRITFSKAGAPELVMGNGLTGVFIDTLCYTGGKLAEEDFQKEIMVRLARLDASRLGNGFTGFDLEELFDGFNPREGSRFLQLVCKNVMTETAWSGLSYSPNLSMLNNAIERFSGMLSMVEKISYPKASASPGKSIYHQCPVHGAYMCESGCVICNNS